MRTPPPPKFEEVDCAKKGLHSSLYLSNRFRWNRVVNPSGCWNHITPMCVYDNRMHESFFPSQLENICFPSFAEVIRFRKRKEVVPWGTPRNTVNQDNIVNTTRCSWFYMRQMQPSLRLHVSCSSSLLMSRCGKLRDTSRKLLMSTNPLATAAIW